MKRKVVASAAEAAAILSGEPGAGDRVKRLSGESWLVDQLAAARTEKGITQRELARRMGCSAAKVCTLESSVDRNVRLGDLVKYVNAMGMDVSLAFEDKGLPAAEQIKRSVFAIHDRLNALAELAGKVSDDQSIIRKIHEFYGQVLMNFLAKFGDSHGKLCRATKIHMLPPDMKLEAARSAVAPKLAVASRRHSVTVG